MAGIPLRRGSSDTETHRCCGESGVTAHPGTSGRREGAGCDTLLSAPGPQDWETIRFCRLGHPVCGTQLMSPSGLTRWGWSEPGPLCPQSPAMEPASVSTVAWWLAHPLQCPALPVIPPPPLPAPSGVASHRHSSPLYLFLRA